MTLYYRLCSRHPGHRTKTGVWVWTHWAMRSPSTMPVMLESVNPFPIPPQPPFFLLHDHALPPSLIPLPTTTCRSPPQSVTPPLFPPISHPGTSLYDPPHTHPHLSPLSPCHLPPPSTHQPRPLHSHSPPSVSCCCTRRTPQATPPTLSSLRRGPPSIPLRIPTFLPPSPPLTPPLRLHLPQQLHRHQATRCIAVRRMPLILPSCPRARLALLTCLSPSP